MALKESINSDPVSRDCLGDDMKAKCKRLDIGSGIHCNFEEKPVVTCFAVTEMRESSGTEDVISETTVRVISKTKDVIPPGFELCKNILTLQEVALPFFRNED